MIIPHFTWFQLLSIEKRGEYDLHIHSQPRKIKCGAPLERLKTMFGFKTEEEKEILSDYNNVVRDMKELKDLVDQMSTTIATQAQMIDTRDQLLDEAYLKLESAETELIIRRKNDEFRQKLAVIK